MTNIPKTAKLFFFLFILTAAAWFGSYIARHLVMYQFYFGEEFILRSDFTPAMFEAVLKIIYPLLSVTIVSYTSAVLFFILFLLTAKLSFRKEGWLFIAAMLFLLPAPYEIYILTGIDLSILIRLADGNFESLSIMNDITGRLKLSGSYTLILLFSSITVLYMFVFQPFRSKKPNED